MTLTKIVELELNLNRLRSLFSSVVKSTLCKPYQRTIGYVFSNPAEIFASLEDTRKNVTQI